MYKVIVAHPSRQHSYKTAEALKKAGILYKYITRVYNNGKSPMLKLAKRFADGDMLRRIENRQSKLLGDSVLIMDEFFGYIQQILGKLDKKKRLYFRFFDWSAKHFEIKVAKYAIRENVDAIIFYDTAAYWGMKYIKKHNSKIVCILDNSTIPINYRKKLLLDNKKECGEYWKTLEHMDDAGNDEKRIRELTLADFHLVASTVSMSGLLYNNIQKDKVYIVPYGVEETYFGLRGNAEKAELVFLFVGHINQIKGIAQILECAVRLREKSIKFVLVGSGRETYPELYPDIENVTYMGVMTGNELRQIYLDADVFLFPAMGDGFGLVLLEALASGLPVIATRNCGAPDIITDGQDGFLMENSSAECLLDKIMWFFENRKQLTVMSVRAREKARQFSWERYDDLVVNAVKDMLKDR